MIKKLPKRLVFYAKNTFTILAMQLAFMQFAFADQTEKQGLSRDRTRTEISETESPNVLQSNMIQHETKSAKIQVQIKTALAQEEIKGKVIDLKRNEPIIGATVIVKGTNIGSVTDFDGNFSLLLPEGSTEIVVSYLGYKAKTIQVGNQSFLTIYLEDEGALLDEFVILGYDVQRKKDLTGSVAVVNMDEIKSLPVASVETMLVGRAPGVQVLSDNGPGGNVSIRIRGFGTVNNNDPLYVIDGTPVSNGLNSINPQDIESLQVLKDAAASSIYGSRAANGVVIITTKKGRSTVPSITLDAYTGFQQAFNLPRMLSAQEYGDQLWKASSNDGRTPASDVYGQNPLNPTIPQWLNADQTIPSADVDWVNEIFRTAPVQSYNLSVAKGGEDSNHVLTLGYFNQDGIIKHTGFDRYSLRYNSDYTLKKFLNIGQNFTASLTRTNDVATNSSLGSIVYDAFQFPSIVPVKDINGNFGGNPLNDISNPLGNLTRQKDNTKNRIKLMGNVFGDVKINDNLNFRTNFGLDFENFSQRSFAPIYNELLSQRVVNRLSDNSSFYYQLAWTNTLNYNKKFGNSTLDLLLGQESIENYAELKSASREGFLYEDPNFQYLSYGTQNQQNSGSASKWNLLSFFGKANYALKDKYLISATLRYDGTSRLANNKWDVFPAFSVGWRLSEESFLDLGPKVNELKIRGSWGRTGNQQVPTYSTLASFQNNINYSNYAIDGAQESVAIGLVETRVANANLNWELTTQSGVGIDLEMFDNKLLITADYFNKSTDNLLIYAPIPPTYGGTNDGAWINGGKMRNHGFELGSKYSGQAGNVFYNVGLNYSFYKNKLEALSPGVSYLGIPASSLHSVNFGQEVSRTLAGQPIGTFFGYDAIGIFQSQEEISTYGLQPNARPGDLKFKDINGDGVINAQDRTAIGSPHPKAIIGFNTNLYYRGFDLAMFFNGSFGHEIYNLTKYKTLFFNQSAYNKSSDIINAWSPQNTLSNIPRLSLDDPNENIRPSSYYLENASFLKLNNLQLGYSFPASAFQNLELRLYAQASNLFTITNYSGMTPEIGLQNYSSNSRNLDIGVDRGVYPPSRTFMVGFNVKF